MKRSLDEVVEFGNTVQVSDNIEGVHVEGADDGKIRLQAVYSQKPEEHVVYNAELGGEVETHARSKLAGIADGQAVYLVPARYHDDV